MRAASLTDAADDGGRPAADYEARKRQHQQTQDQCTAAGLQFVPLVAEACAGGWAPAAVQTWRQLGKAVAARSGEPESTEVDRLLQALAVTLQRENARAVLRRLGEPAGGQEGPFTEP